MLRTTSTAATTSRYRQEAATPNSISTSKYHDADRGEPSHGQRAARRRTISAGLASTMKTLYWIPFAVGPQGVRDTAPRWSLTMS